MNHLHLSFFDVQEGISEQILGRSATIDGVLLCNRQIRVQNLK